MKKLVLVLLCMVLVFSMIGCDSDAKAKAECGQRAYDALVTASELCEYVGDVVYNAWYFSIYKVKYPGMLASKAEIEGFCEQTGLSMSELEKGVVACKGSEDFVQFLDLYIADFDESVDIAIYALSANGTLSELEKALNTAKSELKTMTQEYRDYTEYPNLKALYSEVDSYAAFVQNPACSFEQLKTIIEKYETNIRTYKADLSFIFEE